MYYFYERQQQFSIIGRIWEGGWIFHGLFELKEILNYIKKTCETGSYYYQEKVNLDPGLFAVSWNDLKRFLVISDKGKLFCPNKKIVLVNKRHIYYFPVRRHKWRKSKYRMHSLLADAKNPESKSFIRKHYDYAFWEEEKYFRDNSKSWKDQSKKRKQWMKKKRNL